MRVVLMLVTALATAGGSAAAQAGSETLGEVRVHGNHTTPDADVLALAGLSVGSAIDDESLRLATERLRDSGRFANVELRKRFRSIDNPSDILVIVLVDEHPAVSATDLIPGPLKKIRTSGMWLPVLGFEDGYGFTYGARVSFVDTLGPRSRISVPLTWGGERRAGVEVERNFSRGPLSRIRGSIAISRRENPHFLVNDTRRDARVRVERAVTSWLRVGAGARVSQVRFGNVEERHVAPSADLVVDTRIDPAFPRNAVHVTAGIEQLRFADSGRVARWQSDVRGYLGLVGSSVLALRATTIRASEALPAYEHALLGGTSILRGYEFGYRAGDNLAAVSAEVRVPVTSPLNIARFGVKGFVDAGTVYAVPGKLSDQRFDRGVGGGVWLTATVLHAGLDVAWPRSERPRVHFSLGLAF